jgi:hypothetical protein
MDPTPSGVQVLAIMPPWSLSCAEHTDLDNCRGSTTGSGRVPRWVAAQGIPAPRGHQHLHPGAPRWGGTTGATRDTCQRSLAGGAAPRSRACQRGSPGRGSGGRGSIQASVPLRALQPRQPLQGHPAHAGRAVQPPASVAAQGFSPPRQRGRGTPAPGRVTPAQSMSPPGGTWPGVPQVPDATAAVLRSVAG